MTSRVLVVEDEPALARGLADHFRDEGYDVRVVGRGDQAIPALREYRPQLVVLDILMLVGIMMILCNTLADLAYGALDPRVRVS